MSFLEISLRKRVYKDYGKIIFMYIMHMWSDGGKTVEDIST